MLRTILAAATMLCSATVAGAQESAPVRFGTVALKGDAGFVHMPAERFGEEFGVDIDVQAFRGDSILLRGLLAGELDAYIGNPGGPIVAASRGADIKILGCPWPGLTYALFAKPEIASVEDLKGGSIGVSAPASLPDLFARAVILASGLSIDDVTFSPAGSDSERVAAASAGIITAAPSSSEFVATAEQFGLRQLVHARDVVPQYTRFCIMTTGAKLAENSELYERFLAAEIAGFRFALDNRDETIALSYEKANLPAEDQSPVVIYDEVVEHDAVDPDMDVDLENLRWLAGLLVETGNMDAGFDPATMVDTETLAAAKARVQGN